MTDGKPDTTARDAFVTYILSDDYRRLLRRAIASRLGTTSTHTQEHIKALDLFDAAYPELERYV